jgi:hypothetical protein
MKPSPTRSTHQGIAIRRLHSQGLAQAVFNQPADVLAWMGAVQGQDYLGAKWSLGLRMIEATDASVEQALAEKSIVRSWVLRGTLHLVAATDLRWLLALVAPRLIAGNARRYRELELDEATLVRGNDLLAGAVRNAGQLDRKRLLTILERNGISTAGQRGVYLLQRASLEGLICQITAPRNNSIFVSMDGFPPNRLEREQALAELAKRYFRSRGPATLQDFIWWSGLAAAEARAGLEAVRLQLVEETVNGQAYWSAESARTGEAHWEKMLLLPGFDEYLLAYKDRSASLESPLYNRSTPPNGMLPSTIVLGGRVVGTWKRTIKKSSVFISSDPFEMLASEERRALAEAVDRYARFLGLSSVVV